MPADHRHAAIMFTDIVGYTSLMGSDEDRAFEVLRKNREIHSKYIEQFNGTLIKEMGDGMLISFDLASEAVRCAIEVQKACKAQDIPLKIGIHEGEMVFEGNDVLGDGVNVASRIQDGAEEGCILISGSVYRDIKNKADIQTEFVGEKQFKNVDEKIRIYRVGCGEEVTNHKRQNSNQPRRLAGKTQNTNSKKRKIIVGFGGSLVIIIIISLIWFFSGIYGPPSPKASKGEEKSIAVRPFWNESTNEENEAFVNGMTEDIRNALSNIAGLQVRSRGSVEKYKDHQFTTSNIADELGVTYILEGTVQRIEDFVKINVQLIEPGKNEDHIWKETYEVDLSEINKMFQIQSEIAKSVANALKIFITDEAKARIEIVPTNDKKAYEFCINGRYELSLYYKTLNWKHLPEARKQYDKALEIDPNYADAYAYKASTFVPSNNRDSVLYYADLALKIDPNHPLANNRKARYHQFSGNTDLAIEYYLKSLQHDPNHINSNIFLGEVYCFQQWDIQKGYPYLIKAMQLIGNGTEKLPNIANPLLRLGEYEKAEIYYQRHLKSDLRRCSAFNEYCLLLLAQGKFKSALNFTDSICPLLDCGWYCHEQYVGLNAFLNDLSTAKRYIKEWEDQIRTRFYTNEIGYVYHNLGKEKEAEEVFEECLKILSNRPPNAMVYFWQAQILAFQNRKNEALQSIKMIDEMGLNFNLFDIMTHDPMFENLRDDPEFKAILKEVQDEKASVRAQIREMEAQEKLDL